MPVTPHLRPWARTWKVMVALPVCPSWSVMVTTTWHASPACVSVKSPPPSAPPKATTAVLPVFVTVAPPGDGQVMA